MSDPAAEGWEQVAAGKFMTAIGPLWRRWIDGGHEYGLLAQAKHANHRNIVHGGVIMTFADYAIGMVAADLAQDQHQVTAQLDVQFVAAAELGSFMIGRGEVVRRTSSLFFIRGTIEAGGKVVASAQGIWKVVKPISATRPMGTELDTGKRGSNGGRK